MATHGGTEWEPSLPPFWMAERLKRNKFRPTLYVCKALCVRVCASMCSGVAMKDGGCRLVDGSSFSHSKSFDVSLNLILFSSASGAGGIDASFIHAVFVCVAMCVRLREEKPACFLHHN